MTMTISKRSTALSFFLIMMFSCLTIQAQTYEGKIISKPGGEVIPYANIMVKGSTLGVASDVDGKFAITIPSKYKEWTLIITAVGYTNKEMQVSELSEQRINTIVLTAQDYHIDEVDVEAESRVLYGAVKKCSQNIAKNYITEPYSCEFSYTKNNKTAKGIITDKSGYERSTFKETFRKISYKFNATEKEDPNKPYFEGATNMEDLLSYDLIRTVGNIIDEQNVYDYELSLIPNSNSKQWVIHFAAKEPELYNTGDAHATSYEGELYILKDSYAINRIDIRGTSEKRSIHGRSVAVSEKSSKYISNVNYDIAISYTEENGKFRLNAVKMIEKHTDSNNNEKKIKSSFSITKQLKNVEDIKGRDYFIE